MEPIVYIRLNPMGIVREAEAYGRLSDMGGWPGWAALGEYLCSLAEDIGEPIEFDVIACCCDFSHYDSREEAEADGYDVDESLAVELDDGGVILHA